MLEGEPAGPGGEHPRYVCRRGRETREHEPLGVAGGKLERALWLYMEWLLGAVEVGAELEELMRRRAAEKIEGEPARWRRRIAVVDRDLENYLRGYAMGTIPETVFLDVTMPLRQERDELEARWSAVPSRADLDAMRSAIATSNPAREIAAVRRRPADLQIMWLRRLLDRIEVRPGTLIFHHAAGLLPPYTMPLPRQYAPGRGVGLFSLPDGTVRH